MSVDDFGLEVLKKAAVEISSGEYKLRVDVVSTVLSTVDFATETTLAAILVDTTSIDGKVSTLAEQQSQTTLLTSLDGKDFATQTTLAAISAQLPATLGQKASAASLAVVIASDQSNITVDQGTSPWVVSAGAEKVEDTADAGGATGNFILAVRRNADAATAADGDYTELQTDENGYLKTIDNIAIAFLAAGNVNTAAISAQLPATLGQKAMAASLAVVIASDQSNITVDQGTSPWVIGDGGGSITIDGTVTAEQGTPPWEMEGDIAADAADTAGSKPLKFGGRADTSNAGPTAISTDGDRVNAWFDELGRLQVKSQPAFSDVTLTTDLDDTFDGTTTTSNTGDLAVGNHRVCRFSFELTKVNAPTDITFELQHKDSAGNYNTFSQGYWGKLIFTDTGVGSGINKSYLFPVPAGDTIRIVATANAAVSNTFTIDDSEVRFYS